MAAVAVRTKFRRAGARSRPRLGRARPARFDTRRLRILNPRIADHPQQQRTKSVPETVVSPKCSRVHGQSRGGATTERVRATEPQAAPDTFHALCNHSTFAFRVSHHPEIADRLAAVTDRAGQVSPRPARS